MLDRSARSSLQMQSSSPRARGRMSRKSVTRTGDDPPAFFQKAFDRLRPSRSADSPVHARTGCENSPFGSSTQTPSTARPKACSQPMRFEQGKTRRSPAAEMLFQWPASVKGFAERCTISVTFAGWFVEPAMPPPGNDPVKAVSDRIQLRFTGSNTTPSSAEPTSMLSIRFNLTGLCQCTSQSAMQSVSHKGIQGSDIGSMRLVGSAAIGPAISATIRIGTQHGEGVALRPARRHDPQIHIAGRRSAFRRGQTATFRHTAFLLGVHTARRGCTSRHLLNEPALATAPAAGKIQLGVAG